MRKLRLDSLQVESFDTTSDLAAARGTVAGNAECSTSTCGTTTTIIGPATYDRDCPYTEFFDCTFGCSRDTRCADYCWVEPATRGCEVK